MNISLLWESLKTPLRQALLFAYSLVLNTTFEFAASKLGFEFTPEQKAQLLTYGTPLVWAILSWLDNLLHKGAKIAPVETRKEGLLGLRGLTGF